MESNWNICMSISVGRLANSESESVCCIWSMCHVYPHTDNIGGCRSSSWLISSLSELDEEISTNVYACFDIPFIYYDLPSSDSSSWYCLKLVRKLLNMFLSNDGSLVKSMFCKNALNQPMIHKDYSWLCGAPIRMSTVASTMTNSCFRRCQQCALGEGRE